MTPSWTPTVGDDSDCQNCGSDVSLDFRRVFGDRDHVAHVCPDCSSMTEINRGAAAGLEIDYESRSQTALLTDGGDSDE